MWPTLPPWRSRLTNVAIQRLSTWPYNRLMSDMPTIQELSGRPVNAGALGD